MSYTLIPTDYGPRQVVGHRDDYSPIVLLKLGDRVKCSWRLAVKDAVYTVIGIIPDETYQYKYRVTVTPTISSWDRAGFDLQWFTLEPPERKRMFDPYNPQVGDIVVPNNNNRYVSASTQNRKYVLTEVRKSPAYSGGFCVSARLVDNTGTLSNVAITWFRAPKEDEPVATEKFWMVIPSEGALQVPEVAIKYPTRVGANNAAEARAKRDQRSYTVLEATAVVTPHDQPVSWEVLK